MTLREAAQRDLVNRIALVLLTHAGAAPPQLEAAIQRIRNLLDRREPHGGGETRSDIWLIVDALADNVPPTTKENR